MDHERYMGGLCDGGCENRRAESWRNQLASDTVEEYQGCEYEENVQPGSPC